MSGAYLLTWTTYGTWLPGDNRGFVGRVPEYLEHDIHNRPATPYDTSKPLLVSDAKQKMRHDRVVLNRSDAAICVNSFDNTAQRHSLTLLLGVIMPTHIHLVAHSNELDGIKLLQLFKGSASRRLNPQSQQPKKRWWTKSGSRRLLANDKSIEGALRYVRSHEKAYTIFGNRAG